MAEAFTIRIFVPDGDPDSLRIVDRMNWTGIGLSFSRTKWKEVRERPEFKHAGVYILVGYEGDEDELLTIYIGQGDGVRTRIESHYQRKEFWNRGIVFVSSSTSSSLNRAHINWLEYALVKRAKEKKRCQLANSNEPQEPGLTEAEKADTKAFLREILQILPLLDLHVFTNVKPITTPKARADNANAGPDTNENITVVVSARVDSFEKVFIEQNCWYAIRISSKMLDKIKYVAIYQKEPVAAITHYAPVDSIEPYGDSGKYRLVFSEEAQELNPPIPYGDAGRGFMQGTRYTTLKKLQSAKQLIDVF